MPRSAVCCPQSIKKSSRPFRGASFFTHTVPPGFARRRNELRTSSISLRPITGSAVLLSRWIGILVVGSLVIVSIYRSTNARTTFQLNARGGFSSVGFWGRLSASDLLFFLSGLYRLLVPVSAFKYARDVGDIIVRFAGLSSAMSKSDSSQHARAQTKTRGNDEVIRFL